MAETATVVGAAATMTIGGGARAMETVTAAMAVIFNNRFIRNPIAMRNRFMCRHQYAISRRNRPASIWFFRLTFVEHRHAGKPSRSPVRRKNAGWA